MESPIPILPLPTPDAETEKLIRMKDEEVCGAVGVAEAGSRDALPRCCSPARLSPPARPQLRRMQEMLQRMKQQMQDQ